MHALRVKNWWDGITQKCIQTRVVGTIRYMLHPYCFSLKYHFLKSSSDVTCTLLSLLPLFVYFCVLPSLPHPSILFLMFVSYVLLHTHSMHMYMCEAQFTAFTGVWALGKCTTQWSRTTQLFLWLVTKPNSTIMITQKLHLWHYTPSIL